MPLDFQQFKALVKQVEIGKSLPDAIYTHKSAIDCYPQALLQLIGNILRNLKIQSPWNIIKLYKRDFKLTFLSYPRFDEYAYPELNKSITVDLTQLSHRTADYSSSENPPILHRKECFVRSDYPHYHEFVAITAEGETAGLYQQTRQIGFKKHWHKKIISKGLALTATGRLLNANKATPQTIPGTTPKTMPDDLHIDRHLTAIERNKLSAPIQTLAKNSYLNGNFSILDYGCGKGDDKRELEAHGLDIVAWDPVHYPEGERLSSQIVNLGFVINVIEDIKERSDTLCQASKLSQMLLVVSAMVAGESFISQFVPYKDGVITSRNTFQKYYSQGELKSYIEHTLGQNAIAVGQGIFYVFKDKIKEQDYLLGRQKNQQQWHSLSFKDKPTADQTGKVTNAIKRHPELFADFYHLTLDIGRIPANQEFEFSEDIRHLVGSHKKAFDGLQRLYGQDDFKRAKRQRKEDLLVYFALALFEKRKTYSKMPESLKRDIKSFFDVYAHATELATTALFSVGSAMVIEEAAIQAWQQLKKGEFNAHHSWVIKRVWINQLPLVLRIYIGCATQLYGDIDNFELVKIHFSSGKVSLMRYDDWNKAVPLLVERVKIKLREQDIDFFDYGGDFTPPPLEGKTQYYSDNPK